MDSYKTTTATKKNTGKAGNQISKKWFPWKLPFFSAVC